MKTKTINVYKLSELEDKAKDKAYYKWLESSDYPWSSENEDTLKAFEKLFPIKIKDWSYGGRGEGVTFEMRADDNVQELTGLRLATYIWNNYGDSLFKPKYLGSLSRPKFTPVYSNMQRERSCVLTGYCVDEDILDPVYNFLKKPDNQTLEDIMNDCLQSWVIACSRDAEYRQSMEYFEEEAEANDMEFDENGNRI